MKTIDNGLHSMLDRGELLRALRAFRRGDFSVRMPLDLGGLAGEIAQAFNDVVETNESLAEELARVSNQVGREGRIAQRLSLPAAGGAWADSVESVNNLIDDMAYPVNEVARVMGAIGKGDLSQSVMLEVDG